MSETRYTDQHEWVRIDGDSATVGITKYAAEQLGDVVYVELPSAGKKVTAGGEAATVESVKAASEVYSPVAGEVTIGNELLVGDSSKGLAADPAKVNADPEGEGWFFKMKLSGDDYKKLMTKDQYTEFLKGL
jgi:glycine cleavage system H protein